MREDACIACCESFSPKGEDLNPVVASLLYTAASKVLEQGGVAGCDVRKALLLREQAEERLTSGLAPIGGTVACDVVLCCTETTSEADLAVQSLLGQRDAHLIIHLVDDGGGGAEITRRYAGARHVFTYGNPVRRGPLRTLHELVPRLRSAYVAFQDPKTISSKERIRSAVSVLEAYGAEFLAAPVRTPSGIVYPERPSEAYRRYLPLQSLVCRRASLVDMGGIADRPDDADVELIYRAFSEGRKIVHSDEPSVDSSGPLDAGKLGPPPRYEFRGATLRHHAIGFEQESVQCDVILPFHGHLDFVGESLPSVLEQEAASTIVHLVDDATPGGTEEFLRYWGTHPRVRTYRNYQNLGQFVSFNNVFPYLETNLVAIQDADDISLPHRFRLAGNQLRLADADIFGGCFEIFEHVAHPQSDTGPLEHLGNVDDPIRPYSASEYPRRYERVHFLQNPTAVMRKAVFEMLRGFSDYGDTDRNKCGLDTEFYVRAHHSGCRFALTREAVVRYRWHPKSVTRNSYTGWGTAPREWSMAENERRFKLFHHGPFDARAWGSLRQSWGLTHRIT